MIVNAYDGLTKLPKPEVHLYDFYLNDNDDGYVDAGDTLELGFVLRNRWGMSRDTVVTLDTRSWLGYDTNDGTPINGPENQYVEIIRARQNSVPLAPTTPALCFCETSRISPSPASRIL